MPFKNVHDLWKKVKTSTRDDAYFFRTFMAFELTHYLFELEQINSIRIIIAPIILDFVVGFWINPFCNHNKFQKQQKWFSIFTKSKQTGENKTERIEKNRERERERLT
jgi:hypothetical protein